MVEMLVVLGIIVLLISLLLPMISSARKSAEVTKCLGQLRELMVGVQQYTYDNDGVMPDASFSNSAESGYSPRGLTAAGFGGYQAWDPIPKPSGGGQPSAADLAAGAYCMPSIGAVLVKYVGSNGKIWKCPSQASARAGGRIGEGKFGFRTEETAGAYNPQAAGALAGNKEPDEFRPGYRYMATKEYVGPRAAKTAAPGSFVGLVTVNVAGLPTSRFKTLGTKVVVFTDYTPSFHSVTEGDLFDPTSVPVTNARTAPPDYQANFAYLDGHAETRKFSNLQEYVAQFGQGWRETYWGQDYRPVQTQ